MLSGSDFLVKSRIATDVETDDGGTTPVKFRKSEKDELAKAHQVPDKLYMNK